MFLSFFFLPTIDLNLYQQFGTTTQNDLSIPKSTKAQKDSYNFFILWCLTHVNFPCAFSHSDSLLRINIWELKTIRDQCWCGSKECGWDSSWENELIEDDSLIINVDANLILSNWTILCCSEVFGKKSENNSKRINRLITFLNHHKQIQSLFWQIKALQSWSKTIVESVLTIGPVLAPHNARTVFSHWNHCGSVRNQWTIFGGKISFVSVQLLNERAFVSKDGILSRMLSFQTNPFS